MAIGADGEPTTDSRAAVNGALLPFAAHKGFALGVAVHAFGVMCAPTDADGFVTGHVLIAFAPDLFVPLARYQQLLTTQLDLIRSTPRRPSATEIRVPGDRAYRDRERLRRDGIYVDRDTYEEVVALTEMALAEPGVGESADVAGPVGRPSV